MKHLIAGLLCAALSVEAMAQVVIVQPATTTINLRNSLSEPGVMRSGQVQVSTAVVRDLVTTTTAAEILIQPFSGENFTVALDKKTTGPDPDSYTMTGHVKDQPLATFHMSVVGEATAIDLRQPDGTTYAVRYRGNGVHESLEIAEDALPACGVGPHNMPELTSETISSVSSRDVSVAADLPNEIDVLVAYTQDAENQAGGPDGIQSLINQAFGLANTGYVNSQIPITIIKRATVKVNYSPNVDMGVDLSLLRGATDGFMDDVHAIRDAHKADMVCLLRGSSSAGACGIGYLLNTNSTGFAPNCFSVVANNCITGHTFTHELGHNMGCHHDKANGSNAIYPYAYGWRWNGTNGTQYRSIMAYSPGFRAPHFSNPNVTYQGTSTGNAVEADNARTISNTANSVANFRQRDSPISPVLMSSAAMATINVPAGSDAVRVLQFGNAGTGTANYTLSTNKDWLSFNTYTGSAAATLANPHTLYIDSDRLTVGQHQGSITVTDPAATNNPKNIPVVLNVHQPIINDNFAGAEIINGSNGTVFGINRYATRQSGESTTIDSRVGQHSIWYKWVAPSNLPVTFDTIGTGFNTLLAAYTGTLGSLTTRGQNDNISSNVTQSRITFTPVAGTTYYIVVDSGLNVWGSTTLKWSTASGVDSWENFDVAQ